MPLRNQQPFEWTPAGLSDAEDGSHSFKGAMATLANLIPAPNDAHTWVCRPGAVPLPNSAQKSTCFLEVGNILYGMRHSATFASKDEPFAYNLLTGTYLTIAGLSSGNLPTSQSDTGDWTPPTATQVGSRIIFTHPGFPGGAGNSPYFQGTFGNVTSGQPQITGINPTLEPFLEIGMRLFGVGVPVGATIKSFSQPNVTVGATGTAGMNNFTVTSATGLAIGQTVAGPGLSSIVTNIVGTTITISGTLGQNLAGDLVTFNGVVIIMSASAVSSISPTAVRIVSAMPSKFGWLDLSDLSIQTQANTYLNVPALSGNPTIDGVQPGMTISGPNIPNGTIIQGSALTATQVPCTFSSGSNVLTLTSLPGDATIAVGMTAAGAGIPIGTVVTGISSSASSTTATLNQNTIAAGPATITFSGAIITLSQSGTLDANGVTVTIAGGTPAAPLWGVGDTNGTPLAEVPVFVEQFSGRAWFGVNTTNPPTAGTTFSDAGLGCQATSASQTILFEDAIPVTAAGGLPLNNQLGGIIQALMVFQGDANIRQITGDQAFGTLATNALNVATGTLSPNSIASTPLGLLFAATDGLRIIDFNAHVSDPIGVRGQGLALPFVNTVTPTRTAAAFNENVYRITINWIPDGATESQRDEFWLHLDLKRWSGPHSFTSDLLAPFQAKSSFVVSDDTGLWQSDVFQTPGSQFAEAGELMTWDYKTVLLPDSADQNAKALNESSIFFTMPDTDQALATAYDDEAQILAQAYVWTSPLNKPRQHAIRWNTTAVFRQLSVELTGNSSAAVRLGTLNLRYQHLGYQLPTAPPREFALGHDILGGPNVLGP